MEELVVTNGIVVKRKPNTEGGGLFQSRTPPLSGPPKVSSLFVLQFQIFGGSASAEGAENLFLAF